MKRIILRRVFEVGCIGLLLVIAWHLSAPEGLRWMDDSALKVSIALLVGLWAGAFFTTYYLMPSQPAPRLRRVPCCQIAGCHRPLPHPADRKVIQVKNSVEDPGRDAIVCADCLRKMKGEPAS